MAVIEGSLEDMVRIQTAWDSILFFLQGTILREN